MKNTDENLEELRTTDEDVISVVEEVEAQVDELPKAWTDEERAQYAIVRGYVESVDDATDAVFVGVPDKVVKRAKRDAK